jgi:signal peptidase II
MDDPRARHTAGVAAPPAAAGRRSLLRDRWVLVGVVAAVVLVVDQLTKRWALETLDTRTIDLPWTLRLNLTLNRGAAFGLGSRYAPLIALAAVCVVVVVLGTTRGLDSRWPRLGVGLVLGGALGNLTDRLFREGTGFLGGAVVDFVDLQWWPVFNVADAAVCVGAVLLVLTAARDGGEPAES